jgi:hypothetical protein
MSFFVKFFGLVSLVSLLVLLSGTLPGFFWNISLLFLFVVTGASAVVFSAVAVRNKE